MRILIPLLFVTGLSACSNNEKWAENVEVPPLNQMTERSGDWSALNGMVGRHPAESGLIDNSPISVDLKARLGASAKAYRDAMMAAEPLSRRDHLLVAVAPNAWLVIDPEDHAFRAGLRTREGWQEWSTAGADVPSLGLE